MKGVTSNPAQVGVWLPSVTTEQRKHLQLCREKWGGMVVN